MNNQDYKNLAADLIYNAFSSNQNPRGKISDERQYAEMVLRKLLDWNQDKQLTLGNKDVQAEIRSKFAHDFAKFVLDTVEAIRDPGNKNTHTQYRDKVTEQQLDEVTDAVFDLLASLFINYFNKHGLKQDTLRSFSLLPPIIRYKVWKYLYEQNKQNNHVNLVAIDELVLSILKTQSKEAALSWVEANKAELMNLNAMSIEEYEKFKNEIGPSFAEEMYNRSPTIYRNCLDKIESVSQDIERNGGLLYTDFETAKKYYLEKGILEETRLDGTTDAGIVEFNDLMEFVYLGRVEAGDVEVKPPLQSAKIEPPSLEDWIEAETMDELIAVTKAEGTENT